MFFITSNQIVSNAKIYQVTKKQTEICRSKKNREILGKNDFYVDANLKIIVKIWKKMNCNDDANRFQNANLKKI